MSEHLLAEFIELLHIEELLRLRKRCQMQKKLIMAAILTNVIEERDARERSIQPA